MSAQVLSEFSAGGLGLCIMEWQELFNSPKKVDVGDNNRAARARKATLHLCSPIPDIFVGPGLNEFGQAEKDWEMISKAIKYGHELKG